MSPLPRAFRRDAARIARLTEVERCDGPPQTLHLKRVARELRQIVTRWRHDPVCLAEGKAIHLFQSQLQSMEGHLEKFYLASLHELLEKWRKRFIHELLLRGEIITHQLVHEMPTEELLIEFKKAITDGKPENYDPEGDYRETQNAADAAAEAYRAEWAEFKASWPERIDAPFLARLENLTIQDLNAWVAELRPGTA